MTPRSIMIFAAGRGTRMGNLTDDQPKPLIKVGGRALIDHALDLADSAGPLIQVVNTHYKADMLLAHLSGRNLQISHEHDGLLETGGGLRKALPLLGKDPVFTMNSDAVWRGPNPLTLLADNWDRSRMEALLLILPPAAALGHTGTGDFEIKADGRLTRGRGFVYSGAQIIQTGTLQTIPQTVFSLNVLWDEMASRGGLFGLIYPGKWCDVGRPESIALAIQLLKEPDVS